MQGKEKKIGFIFPVDLHREFKSAAHDRGVTMKHATIEAVSAWINNAVPIIDGKKRKAQLIRDGNGPTFGDGAHPKKMTSAVDTHVSGEYSALLGGGLSDDLVKEFKRKLKEFEAFIDQFSGHESGKRGA